MVILISSSLAFGRPAQDSARFAPIDIEVTDPNGAVVPKARVWVLPMPDTFHGAPMTGSNGKLSLDLPAGPYTLRVQVPGMLSWKRDIEAKPGARQTIPVQLRIGSYSNCVNITTLSGPPPQPLSIPEQRQVFSPDGRYRLVSRGWPFAPRHSVIMEDRVLKTRRTLFQYHKSVNFLWYGSTLLVATDDRGDDSSRSVYYSVHKDVPPIQALDLVFSQMEEDERNSLKRFLGNERVRTETGHGGPCAAMRPWVRVSAYGKTGSLDFEWSFGVEIPNRMY